MTIGEGGCTATIATLGAELTSWSVGGRELLWQRDPAFWGRSAPILFPVVGRSHDNAVRVAGKRYPMPVHGFAPMSQFMVESADAGRAVLVLEDTARTRQAYPFSLRLTVAYEAGPDCVKVSVAIDNNGDTPMPYAVGLHPGFNWPERGASRQMAMVEFDRDEVPAVPVITAEGYFADDSRPLHFDDRKMPLSLENLGDEAVCFIDARSRRFAFLREDGSSIVVENGDFPHFAIWTRHGAPFLSLESWTGHGDKVGFDGELAERSSMRVLMPNAEAEHSACYSFRAENHG